MAGEEISLDEQKKYRRKKFFIIVITLLVMLGTGMTAYYYYLLNQETTQQSVDRSDEYVEEDNSGLDATYVAMPRPFVFNVMDGKRDRLVQIKVQLMVRGTEYQKIAKKHIPLLEGTLVRIFGAASVYQLRSPEGRDKLREYAREALNQATKKLEGKALVDAVLFTGFVLQ